MRQPRPAERAPAGAREAGGRELKTAAVVAGALLVFYGALRPQTWSLDGVLHTLQSSSAIDAHSSGHLLLRPVAWAWTGLWSALVPLDLPARYELLHLLFGLMGVGALTLVSTECMRLGAPGSVALALVAVAVSRDTLRHITVLDEKPLGMLLLAFALVVTSRALARYRREDREPTPREWLLVMSAWVLAMFGHLQNVPFAAATAGASLLCFSGPGRFLRWARCQASAAVVLVPAALAVLVLLHVGGTEDPMDGFRWVLNHLFSGRPSAEPAGGLPGLAKDSLQGYAMAFFLVDRLSPAWLAGLTLLGAPVVYLAMALGVWRRRDPLAFAVAGGSVALMLLMPIANFFPSFGDSYTALVLASPLLLSSAPRAWNAASALLLLLVNLPTAIAIARPETSMRAHLAELTAVQSREQVPWVLLEELTPFDREQGLCPPYYAMRPALEVERAGLASLPPGRFLLELPGVVRRDGRVDGERVGAVQRELEQRGRACHAARLHSALRLVRTDFRRYGDYLVVEAAGR